MRNDDPTRVRHMIDAAEAVEKFVSGRSRSDLDSDQMLVFALTHAIAIIGEAASRISDRTRATATNVPWSQIIAIRNRLIHAYFDVNREILWKTATEEVPLLLSELRRLDQAE